MTPNPSDDGLRDDEVAFAPGDVEKSISERFESCARRYPQRVALAVDTIQVTYRDLDLGADRIARALVALCGPRSEPVMLLTGSEVASIFGTLAILKAGKFFVTLDPAQPDARQKAIIEESCARVMLCNTEAAARARALAPAGVTVLDIDTIDGRSADTTPLPAPPPNAPATIVFTSGSTGRPKGVVQSQASILHNIFVHTRFLAITAQDRLTLLSSRGTGQAMTGMFSALLNGAALHPFDLRTRGLSHLGAWLVANRITIYHSSASVFRELAGSTPSDMRTTSLRVVKLGSEPVSRRDVDLFRERFPRSCMFVNALSSTETGTICQRVVEWDSRIEGDSVPAGYPVDDVEVLLLDDHGDVVAPGEVGEICVRSRYLATEYWQNEALTRQAFVPDPGDSRMRMFHTGDLGRMTPNGGLECLGRKDSRVKIRGNRVETAEVEMALLTNDAVKRVAVVDRDDGRGNTRLVAYVVSASGAALDARSLRAFLAAKLPRHMLPAGFVFLDALPQTASGKVDRAALPAWQPRATAAARAPVPPRDLLETQLANIWEALLGVDGVGIHDDFFERGGDSLLAVEMAIRVEQACGVKVPLQDMIDELTIEKLARILVDRERDHVSVPIAEVQAGGSQRAFFFAHGAIASDGFYCRVLARGLGDDRPFYAIHPHGLDGQPVPRSIQAMAADRLEALRATQPHGPYLLGGFCAGGAIALEMARRLRASGERVDLVVLVDTHASNARFRAWNRCVGAFARVFGLSPATRSALFRRGRVFLRGLERASGRGASGVLLFLARKPSFIVSGVRRRENALPRAPLDLRQAVWLDYHHALEDYVPDRYAGRMVVFRSSHLEHKTPGDFAAGWQHVCENVDVRSIAGDHRTCVTTHAADLAAKMKSCLDAVT